MQRLSSMNPLPVIVTGTIIPHASFVAISDPLVRRNQYVEALSVLSHHSIVWFLENSDYDIDSDPTFRLPNLTVVRYPEYDPSWHALGKGYQEFRMLDSFLARAEAPRRFIKLSGRRILLQMDAFQARYQTPGLQWMDRWQNDGFADTTFFCCDLDFYRQYLSGRYAEANDADGRVIEHVIYDALRSAHGVQFHPFTPRFQGYHGTSGNRMKGTRHIPTETRRLLRRLMGKTLLDKAIFG